MDIADINKVASRKRMNLEAEKLREKVSREASKIIKLKVAQDTAYWDVKEKLQQLEGNHERLQQNMVEVQMQHEAISGQYQEELRLRPETLNKLSSTREICDVLEEYSERLKQTLSRCKADQGTLCEAYQKSGQLVKEMKVKQLQNDDKHRTLVENLEEKLKLTSDHQKQLLDILTTSRQQADSQISELKTKLDTAHAQRDELVKIANELTRDLDLQKHAIDTKDSNIASLQNDMKRLIQEFNSQCNDMKNTIVKMELELKQSNESNADLKKALSNQEDFNKTICDKNNTLQEKLSTLEDENTKLTKDITIYQTKIQECERISTELNKRIDELNESKLTLVEEVASKCQLLTEYSVQIEDLTSKLKTLELEKSATAVELTTASEDLVNKTKETEDMKIKIQNAEAEITQLNCILNECKSTNEAKIEELTAVIEAKTSENFSKAETINKLMTEIKLSMELRSKLETNIEKAKTEVELEKEKGRDEKKRLGMQIDKLESVVKDKEQELSKQMSIILEIRNEKEKLQEKISGMQNTIDNIQKELTGRILQPTAMEPPELDDNAVALTPIKHSQYAPLKKMPEFAIPRSEPKQDSLMYSIFSDNSMDGDAVDRVDPIEVNRRFEAIARGERLPPAPLPTIKKRRVHNTLGGLAYKNSMDASPISLSQVREEMKNKEKSFFKTKRADNKLKRFKKDDD